jgi:predicted permease
LIRESLVEHGAVGVAGVLGGLAIAAGMLQITLSTLPQRFLLSTMNAIDLDGRTLAFTALVGFVTVILFGLPPAWLASRGAVSEVLKRETRSSAGSVASRRLRAALVISEVALAIVLLVGAALMMRSLVKLQGIDRGFDATGLIAMRVGLPRNGYADAYARDEFTAKLITRLRQLPGVTAATAGGVPPDASMVSFGRVERADRPGELTADLVVPVYQVWPNYFSAIGIPVREGRGFMDAEALDSVVVSESFARTLWPNGPAIGQRVRFEGGPWRTIVGVAGEVRQMNLDDESGSFEMYYPAKRPAGLPQPATLPSGAIASYRSFVLRADDVDRTMVSLRAALRETDPRVVIWRVDPVERLFADAIARPRLVLLLMTVFAGLGLVLAAAGIYGVLSYAVVQRRREIGIRLALGARPQSVGGLILRNGLTLTVVGLVAGVALALALTKVMRTLLYEIEPTDPVSVIGVALLLTIVAVLASWWPARRAMKVDPLTLLRDE